MRARALAATREATVVHVYNTVMISKRVHLYREKQRLTRFTACRVFRGSRPAEPCVAGLTARVRHPMGLHEKPCRALRGAARPSARGFQGGIVIRVCTCACRVPWRMSLVLLCTTPIVRVCHWPVRLMNPGATVPKRFALPSPLRWCPPRPAQTLAPPPPRSASSTLHSQRPGSVFAH